MDRGRTADRDLSVVAAIVVGVVVVVLATERPAPATTAAGAEAADLEVRVSTDGPSVEAMVAVVREHAQRTPGADPTAPVTVVLASDLARETGDDRALLAGLQRGRTAWVRTDRASTELTLVHEVAHVLTDGDDHGPVWRAVYLGAVEELFGVHRAEREARRIAWVHDRCYRTDSCASRPTADASTARHHVHP